MVIQKVINNNVISAYDVNQQEIVIMGKGIGFKAHTGELIDESKIEKVFRIENENLSRQFQELLENIPLEHMQLTSDIISYAIKNLNVQLNQNIYITLTDHINFAIQRQSQGIQLKNALLWETKKFYHQEYLMGKYAVDLLNEKLGTEFTEDEAGFIAMHIINANYRESTNKSCLIMNIINQILDIIKNYYSIEFIEDEINFDRLLTHLKFFAKRLIDKTESIDTNNNGLLEIVKVQYKESYDCVKQIKSFIEENYTYKVNDDEVLYLILHINRVISVINFNKEITKSYV